MEKDPFAFFSHNALEASRCYIIKITILDYVFFVDIDLKKLLYASSSFYYSSNFHRTYAYIRNWDVGFT